VFREHRIAQDLQVFGEQSHESAVRLQNIEGVAFVDLAFLGWHLMVFLVSCLVFLVWLQLGCYNRLHHLQAWRAHVE